MYFTMTTSDKKTYCSKILEGSVTEIGRKISILIAEGGSFELESGNYILFSRKIAENSIFILHP